MSKKSLIDQPTPKEPSVEPVTRGNLLADVSRADLLDALKTAGTALTRSKLIGGWSCIVLRTDAKGLKIEATGLEAYAGMTLMSSAFLPGECAIAASMLTSAIASCPGDRVELQALPDNLLRVKSDGATYKLPCSPIGEVLPAPIPPDGEHLKVDGATWSHAIGQCMTAAAVGASGRTNIEAVHVTRNLDNDEIVHVVATDGHRMHIVDLVCKTSGDDDKGWNITIPASVLPHVRRLTGDVRVCLHASSGWCWFVGDGVDVAVKLLVENYPNWRQVVPATNQRMAVSIDVGLLLAAAKRAFILDKDASIQIDVLAKTGQIEITRESITGGSYREVLAAKVDEPSSRGKEPMDVRTNKPSEPGWATYRIAPKKLVDVLTAAASEEGATFTFHCGWGTQPIRINCGSFTGVIMPMRH